jgi:CheY-like chemotaxis protein/HPt (histidine-containing phosphotransfer) domain-containing protein
MRQHIAHAGGGSGCCGAGQFPAAEGAARARRRILLADDGDDVRRLLLVYLRGTGAEIVEARDGRSACDAAFAAQNTGNDFDLIVLDMEMPHLDGYSAATLLRLQGFTGPIVALTANDAAGDRERCVASGCTEYLRKPVDRAVLVRTIDQHLAARCGANDVGHACETLQPVELNDATPAIDAATEPFLRQFLASLPEYVGVLEDLMGRRAIEQLAQTVHQIKGAAGMYGLERIYEVAASAEGVAKSMARASDPLAVGRRLQGEIDMLIGVIRDARPTTMKTKTEAGVARG